MLLINISCEGIENKDTYLQIGETKKNLKREISNDKTHEKNKYK